MSLRFAEKDDKVAIEDMLMYCFPDMRAGVERRRAEEAAGKVTEESPEAQKEREEHLKWVLVKEEADGSLGQHVQIVPLTIHFDGTLQKMGGIGGVASWPEYRYGGGVMSLLKWSLQIMKERGYPFSELAPFSYAFYRKCGWEWGFRWHELTIPMKELEVFRSDKGTFVRLTEAHREEAARVRNLHGERYNGAEWMDAQKKKDPFPHKGSLSYGVETQDGGLCAYAQFSIRDNALQCRDFFWTDIKSKRQLLHFFQRHNSQAETVKLTVPEMDTTAHLLGDQYLETKARAGMMVRVVDIPPAISAMRVHSSLSCAFVMQVTDEAAPWNGGNWLVRANEGALVAERVEQDPDCMLSIQRLSQLVYGFLSGHEATESGMVTWRNENRQEDFHRIFHKRATAQWIPF